MVELVVSWIALANDWEDSVILNKISCYLRWMMSADRVNLSFLWELEATDRVSHECGTRDFKVNIERTMLNFEGMQIKNMKKGLLRRKVDDASDSVFCFEPQMKDRQECLYHGRGVE